MTSSSGIRPQEKMTAAQPGMAGHGDDVEVHLQGDQDPAGGGVRQHVAEQVGGVALGDLGVAVRLRE